MTVRRSGAIGAALALGLLAASLVACGPTWAIVAENKSDTELLARTLGSTGTDDAVRSVVSLPPDSRTTLGTNGVARLVLLRRVEILTLDCTVVATVALDEFDEGGVIAVGDGPTVEARPGGNPSHGVDGEASNQCSAPAP